MQQGKVTKAVRFRTSHASAGTLQLEENTCQMLSEKHPPAKKAAPETSFHGEYYPHSRKSSKASPVTKSRNMRYTHVTAGDRHDWMPMDRTYWMSENVEMLKPILCKAIATRRSATGNCRHTNVLLTCTVSRKLRDFKKNKWQDHYGSCRRRR